MYGENITIMDGVIVSVFCIVVVFLVLLVISYLIDLTAWVIHKLEGKKKEKEVQNAAVPEEAPAPKAHDDHEDAVLIAAAIAAYLGTSPDQFVVRSIRPADGTESSWSRESRSEAAQ